MAEWFKAAVLKTVSRKRDVGSNPTPSAIEIAAKFREHPRLLLRAPDSELFEQPSNRDIEKCPDSRMAY